MSALYCGDGEIPFLNCCCTCYFCARAKSLESIWSSSQNVFSNAPRVRSCFVLIRSQIMFELQIEFWLEASFWLCSYLSLQNSFFSYLAGMDKWKDVLYIFP